MPCPRVPRLFVDWVRFARWPFVLPSYRLTAPEETAVGFDPKFNEFGIKLKAILGSDIGHWDVTDMNSVLPEAWELVEGGLLDTEEFSAFVFGNVVEFYGRVNPGVFAGTTVEDQASVHLSTLGVKSDQ